MLHLIIGSSAAARRTAALDIAAAAGALPLVTRDAATLPFLHLPDEPHGPAIWLVDHGERAFPDTQRGGTRLVLTQAAYLAQTLIDRAGPDGHVVITADESLLRQTAPEVLDGRGPWRLAQITRLDTQAPESNTSALAAPPPPAWALRLAQGFASTDPNARLQLCREACVLAPDEPHAHLALASALRETGGALDEAITAIDRATTLAPASAAAWFEAGKLFMALEDMPGAADAFARAATCMPTFSAAHSNLGGVLGELDQPDAALAAFDHALTHDPAGYTTLNNKGVVLRELGRLDESIDAHLQVISLAPGFVFGHYNLGHALLLAGRFPESVAAYEAGQALDPSTNRRQACRLAMARFATGDLHGARRDLWRAANQADPTEREDLLLEALEIGQALLPYQPAPALAEAFLEEVGEALT